MGIESKAVDDLQEQDLEDLIGCFEDKTYEFKESIPGRTDDDKKEFLADVTSFANSSGGFLVYGMAEEDRRAVRIEGLPQEEREPEVLRLGSLVRDGVDPRVPGIGFGQVDLKNGRWALVLHIPRSPVLPHRVAFKGSSRFFCRASDGTKYQLGTSEIRRLFDANGSVSNWIRSFRIERIAALVSDEGPIHVSERPVLTMHLVPFASADSTFVADLDGLFEGQLDPLLHLVAEIDLWRCWRRPNLDGVLVYYPLQQGSGKSSGYVQFFRNGCIEAVDAWSVSDSDANDKGISGGYLERRVIGACRDYLQFQTKHRVPYPICVTVQILGVGGWHLREPNENTAHHSFNGGGLERIFDRDVLTLPDVVLEDSSADVDTAFRPAFDTLWNASGFSGSPSYDANGNRLKPKASG